LIGDPTRAYIAGPLFAHLFAGQPQSKKADHEHAGPRGSCGRAVSGFRIQRIATNGTTLHVRIGGDGPAVVLLHGYGETGDMWSPLAAKLVPNHTVIVPDLRGMGLSARPSGGYDKKTQGHDIAGLLDALKIDRAELVTHDIGNMVGYAFAAEYPARVTRFVLI
jgi:pimeloyl-ACP methyl ester carboxylesterase